MTEQPAPRPTPIRETDLPPAAWSTAVPIRFGRCDPAGIVYTPQYFDLFNGVLEDWYGQALGLDYYALIGERRLGLGYATASCDFMAPSRMGDTLRVAVLIARLGGSSVTLTLHAMRDGREVVRGHFVSVSTSLDTHGVVPLPPDVRAALARYQRSCAP